MAKRWGNGGTEAGADSPHGRLPEMMGCPSHLAPPPTPPARPEFLWGAGFREAQAAGPRAQVGVADGRPTARPCPAWHPGTQPGLVHARPSHRAPAARGGGGNTVSPWCLARWPSALPPPLVLPVAAESSGMATPRHTVRGPGLQDTPAGLQAKDAGVPGAPLGFSLAPADPPDLGRGVVLGHPAFLLVQMGPGLRPEPSSMLAVLPSPPCRGHLSHIPRRGFSSGLLHSLASRAPSPALPTLCPFLLLAQAPDTGPCSHWTRGFLQGPSAHCS